MIYRLPPRVVAVRHVREHVLALRFEDGLEGEVDLGDALHGPLLEPLRDTRLFARVRVEGDLIAWANGLDWSPESLYERLRAAKGLPPESIDDDTRRVLAILATMPEISRFFGIVIRMVADDHNPPHFHAQYGEYAASVTIRDALVTGRLPGRVLRMVLEWRDLHERELLANWDRLRSGQPATPIAPLD